MANRRDPGDDESGMPSVTLDLSPALAARNVRTKDCSKLDIKRRDIYSCATLEFRFPKATTPDSP